MPKTDENIWPVRSMEGCCATNAVINVRIIYGLLVCRCSSVEERLPSKQLVTGSSPVIGSLK